MCVASQAARQARQPGNAARKASEPPSNGRVRARVGRRRGRQASGHMGTRAHAALALERTRTPLRNHTTLRTHANTSVCRPYMLHRLLPARSPRASPSGARLDPSPPLRSARACRARTWAPLAARRRRAQATTAGSPASRATRRAACSRLGSQPGDARRARRARSTSQVALSR